MNDGHPEHPDMRAPFRLVDGTLIDVLALKPAEINIETIAHALSQLNRYGGHTPWPYSVALHSVMVSYLVPMGFEYEGLMHDFTEAIACVDVPSPIKRLCPDYKRIELHVREQLYKRFHLLRDEPREVSAVDKYIARRLEQCFLQNQRMPDDIGEHEVEIGRTFLEQPIIPTDAKEMFLERYEALRPKFN